MKRVYFLLTIAVLSASVFALDGFKKPGTHDSKGGTVEFTDANFQNKVLKSDKLTVVDFWAEWCGPCRAIGPVVEDLAKEYNGTVNIGKLNVDNNPNTCMKYNVTSIPTILFIKNGKVVDKLIGAHPKSSLVKKIKAHI